MADDHVSVVVDTHHDIPPMTQAFFDNQERVMIAIAGAVKKNGMKFALPAKISYREKMGPQGSNGGIEGERDNTPAAGPSENDD